MGYQDISRNGIDNAEDLDFESKPPQRTKRARAISVQLAYRGTLVTFTYGREENVPIHELEQSIDTMLQREGWSAPTVAANGPGRTFKGNPKVEYVDPAYDGDGQPMCPVHKRALSDGKWGPFCSAKADPNKGEETNERGYCAIRFKR